MDLAGRHGLVVVEDAACALGTRCAGGLAGTFGAAGCFSFHPRKSLTTGEGGAIAVRDPELVERLALLRNHGMRRGQLGMEFVLAGLNYRMTNFQAALGRVQMRRLDGWIAEREGLQARYRQALEGSCIALPARVDGHAWQTFMVVLPSAVDRGRVMSELKEAGIESNQGAQALHVQPHFLARYPDEARRLEGGAAGRLCRQGLALPLFPDMGGTAVESVSCALLRCVSA
jgi:dTDP-4-amino-4,6-dideoxygalactose transaminase